MQLQITIKPRMELAAKKDAVAKTPKKEVVQDLHKRSAQCSNRIGLRKELNRARGTPIASPGAGCQSENKILRLNGMIPANLMIPGSENQAISVCNKEMQEILGRLKEGEVLTTVFELKDEKNVVRKAIVKEIQRNRINYNIEHIDFLNLDPKKKVTFNVPIRIQGTESSPGIKLGGSVRQVIRSLKVTCLPEDMPKEFILDVSKLELIPKTETIDGNVVKIRNSLTLADIINIGPKVTTPKAKYMQQVAIVIAKKKG